MLRMVRIVSGATSIALRQLASGSLLAMWENVSRHVAGLLR